MRFTVEIYTTADDGSETIVSRTVVSTITPRGARKEAQKLLALQRQAARARILNVQGETVYEIDE